MNTKGDFRMKQMLLHRMAAFVVAALMILSVCGCGKDKDKNDKVSESSSDQTYPVGSYEREIADKASSQEVVEGVVTDFGSKSIFKGITVETDINGEVVCTEVDGELRYKIKDKRFTSYYSLKKFVTKKSGKKSGSKAMNKYSPYFGERDGKLYFIIGANNRSIRDYSQYYLDGSKKLTVDVIHTEESRKKRSVARSQINFVKNKKGEWKLDSLTVWKE